MTSVQSPGYAPVPALAPAESPRVDDLAWAHALRGPQAPVVLGPGPSLTYGELVGRAAALAARLRSAGCGAGTPVALVLERSPELLVAILAVLRAGGVCLTIAPADPPLRMEQVLDEVNPPLVITDEAGAGTVPGQRTVLTMTDDVAEPTDDPGSGADATAAAFIFCTSGSTGRPKPVVVTHHNYTSQLDWVVANFDLSPADVHFLKAPTSFVSLLRQVIWPLATGAAVVIVEPGREHDIEHQAELIDRYAVTFATYITPALDAFCRHARRPFPSLRNAVTGGDRYPMGLASVFCAAFPNARMHHTYGMTEGTLITCALIDRPDADESCLGVIVPGAQAELLDDDGAPVARGEVGEMHIGGVPLTPGYLGRPELNRERFRAGPAGPLFSTRDLARQRPDGRFELVGRADDMVKIRGYRVELGEVERALRRLPSVADAVCRAVTGGAGDMRLTGYLVPVGTTSPPPDAEVLGFLADLLPAYMLPAHLVWLDALPLTPNGKVNRAALPAPTAGPHASASTDGTAGTAAAVRAAWVSILGVTDVGPHSDFFVDGGNSLAAVELAGRLSTELDVDVPVTLVFDHPTLPAFAAAVRELEASVDG
ncbi:non-ribosomal peptide synthetase [Luedemannella helvata]|uniref:Carrier domain-containing protein n=1 Tax=Luedemannella helvata TaxID=349315 RepID=A0ABP4WF99_9ACTN